MPLWNDMDKYKLALRRILDLHDDIHNADFAMSRVAGEDPALCTEVAHLIAQLSEDHLHAMEKAIELGKLLEKLGGPEWPTPKPN